MGSQDKGKGVDMTYLKAFMHEKNMHNNFPSIFKTVNDKAKALKHVDTLPRQEFVTLFSHHALDDSKCDITAQTPPSLHDIVEMFELLDVKRTGMIEVGSLEVLMKEMILMREAKFKRDVYEKRKEKDMSGNADMNQMKEQISHLLKSFSLKKNGLLSPDEFFNIIMFIYE